jgi:F-type H+-transporting ATPase subunit gamma
MESLRDLRRRIRTVQTTQQITRAMEMVSAAKLKRAQNQLESSRPYAQKMEELLKNLSGVAQKYSHPLFEKREGEKIALVIFTSDRGLCGSFNSNVLRKADAFLEAHKDKEVILTCIGKKGFMYFRKKDWKIRSQYLELGGNLSKRTTKEITSQLVNLFLYQEADEIYLLYTKFVSAMTHRVMLEKFLNIEKDKKVKEIFVDYIFEPAAEQIFEALLPTYCFTKIQMALADSFASEHGARMISMGAATENAEEMIDQLTLQRNKARQASITKEMLEIVSGAEALK